MRRCTVFLDSSATSNRRWFGRPYHQRRHLSDTAKDDGDAHSSSTEPKAPAQLGEDGFFKIDQDDKTIETVVGDLPLSPVMDPSFWESRDRWAKAKPKAGKPMNSLERQFAANPFAQALATPIRYDTAARIRLPAYFLQDFHMIAHPETGKPWFVPRSLALNQPPAAVEEEDAQNEEDLQEMEQAAADKDVQAADLPSPVLTKEASSPINKGPPLGPSTYVLARQDLLKAFVTPGSGFNPFLPRIMGASSSPYRNFAGQAVWREDMDTFVLDLMRRRIVQDILYFSKLCVEKQRYYIVRCHGWDDVQYKHKHAVLWFNKTVEGEPAPKNKPGFFATFEFEDKNAKRTTSVAVHDMAMLLGEGYVEQLLKEAEVFQEGSIFALAGRRTTGLQLKLWKLQGYLADYADI